MMLMSLKSYKQNADQQLRNNIIKAEWQLENAENKLN